MNTGWGLSAQDYAGNVFAKAPPTLGQDMVGTYGTPLGGFYGVRHSTRGPRSTQV